jgi:hypothetical protein
MTVYVITRIFQILRTDNCFCIVLFDVNQVCIARPLEVHVNLLEPRTHASETFSFCVKNSVTLVIGVPTNGSSKTSLVVLAFCPTYTSVLGFCIRFRLVLLM